MLHNRVPCFPTDTRSAPPLMATWWCQGEKWEEEEEGTLGVSSPLLAVPLHPCPPPNRHPAIWTCVITEGQRSTPSYPHLLQGQGPGARGLGVGKRQTHKVKETRKQGD